MLSGMLATSFSPLRPKAWEPTGRRGLLALVAFLALFVPACREESPGKVTETVAGTVAEEGVGPSDPLLDSQLAVVDAVTPSTRFDGDRGSLLLADGWAPTQEEQHGDEAPFHYAWAIDGVSGLWAPKPMGEGPWDLWGHCRPYSYEGATPQTITLLRGETPVAEVTLTGGEWQPWRLPIPGGWLRPGLNKLRLRFAYAERPRDVEPGQEDARRLAIACRSLALVPRDLEEVEEVVFASHLDAAQRRLRLAVDAVAAFPLPAASTVTLRWGEMASKCEGCTLSAEMAGAQPGEVLWQGTAEAAAGSELVFETPKHALTRLLLRWQAGGKRGEPLEATLPESFLSFEQHPDEPAPPHVFVYLIDTLRADALSPYGGREETPEVAAFAQDAVTYTAWSASSWTLPSVVSILTGVYPERHGVMRGNVKLSLTGPATLATLLGEAGYDTLGISQSLVASRRFGVDTGFARFYFNNQLNGFALRSQEVRRFLYFDWLHRERPERPVFAYLHTVDPHAPYAPQGPDRRWAEANPGKLEPLSYLPHRFMEEGFGSDPQEVAHLRGLYVGEVAYADRQFGRFIHMLRHLGLYDDSLIVLLSDHGEEFGEHGGFDHGRTVYEEMLWVPLMVKYPHSRGGGTSVSRRVSTVDVVPTVLAEAGIEVPADPFDGTPLEPQGDEGLRRRLVFAEVNPARARELEAVDYRALALGATKCIESRNGIDQFGRELPPWQAFDLEQDPSELQSFDSQSPEVERCRGILERWLEARRAVRPAEEGQGAPTDEEALEKLRALGYID